MGGAGNDVITGDDFANMFAGGAGNDTLNGSAGDNLILAGAGNDGGSGHDVFAFAAGFGKGLIGDFKTTGSRSGVIEFASRLFADFDAAIGAAHQVDADTVFTIDADTAPTLKNVQGATLHADDFHFVDLSP